MIRERRDLDFLFLTKRIERFNACIPEDRGDGWENVTGNLKETWRQFQLGESGGGGQKTPDIRKCVDKAQKHGLSADDRRDGHIAASAGHRARDSRRGIRHKRPSSRLRMGTLSQTTMHRAQHAVHIPSVRHSLYQGWQGYKLNVRQLCSQTRKADINLSPL